MTFTLDDKLKAVKREIAMRRRVYPGWVTSKRMRQDDADREIAVMEAIAEDIEAQIVAQSPGLF